MTNFDLAHVFTSKWEGGLVDHPSDPGGITNHGVSLRFLKGFRDAERIGVQFPITAESIRKLTKEQAKEIMKVAFWTPQKLDELPQLTAIAHYDFSVNGGSRQAVLLLQRCAGVTDDGIIGPKTRQAAQAEAKGYGDLVVALALCDTRQRFYNDLVKARPNFAPFLKGWTNRVNALRNYLESI